MEEVRLLHKTVKKAEAAAFEFQKRAKCADFGIRDIGDLVAKVLEIGFFAGFAEALERVEAAMIQLPGTEDFREEWYKRPPWKDSAILKRLQIFRRAIEAIEAMKEGKP